MKNELVEYIYTLKELMRAEDWEGINHYLTFPPKDTTCRVALLRVTSCCKSKLKNWKQAVRNAEVDFNLQRLNSKELLEGLI